MSNSTMFTLLAGSLLLALGMASPLAANEKAEQAFSRYQQAIEVTKQCREIGFSDSEYDRMSEIINEKIDHQVGAKRLSLLLKAKKDAKKLLDAKGCGSQEAAKLLEIYDGELK